ncbi:MAG: DUF4271 domain-containing protein [Roseivirga sp.]|nr:DUF4271 domain-containing protein [Roseivirga sp.]
MISETLRLSSDLGIIQVMAQRDLFIVLSILLLCIFAVSKVVFPKLFVESISIDKLFGFRVKEDLGSTIRPFSTEHIYFTALFGFNLSFVILYVVNSPLVDAGSLHLLQVTSLWQGLLVWLILGVAVNLAIYLKYGLIAITGWLFHARQVVSRHFIDYINASALFYILATLCLSMGTYATFIANETFLRSVAVVIVLFLFYRTVLLYAKVIQLSHYSKLFIFSYICTTELIPILIGLHFVAK